MNKIHFTLLTAISLFILTPIVNAQETPSLQTQKKVVSGFKIPDTQTYFPFPKSECNDKTRGDANCDGQINQFDLSIWQVELNSTKTPSSPKRSDFNEDGVINLADYAIWQKTTYPQTASIWKKLLNWITVTAQENKPLQSSQVLTSSSGNSQIVNSSNGQNQQITFDENGSPTNADTFDQNGRLFTSVAFMQSGDTITTTQQDGITVNINKTAQGPVIEYFNNPDGTLLAIKSWPNVESLDKNEPPLAVTLPAKDKFLTLNISPNDTSVVVKSDEKGNVLNQTQFRKDGTYSNQDLNSDIQSDSNAEVGLSTIRMSNSLGGKTTYNFYQGGFFAIVQTDSSGNYHIAKPLDTEGNSWSLESTINGTSSTKTVNDPVSEIGSNTPNPKEIIRDINYYQALPLLEGLNFQDGFGSSSSVQTSQITQANQVLKVESANPPAPPPPTTTSSVLGIKEAFAEELTVSQQNLPNDDDDDNEGNSKSRTGGDEDKNNRETRNAASAGAASLAPAATTQAKVGIGDNTANVTVAGNTQTNKISNPAGNVIATNTNNPQNNNTFAAGSASPTAVQQPLTVMGLTGTTPPPVLMGSTPTVEVNTYKSDSSCFLAGTKISTPKGPQNIETLKPGDKVYSYDEDSGQKQISDFKELDINFVDEYLIINNKIHTTTYHPFYLLKNNSLLISKADKLKIGDFMIDESGNPVLVTSIQKIPNKVTVYNLTAVSPNSNFFAEGILVHNYNNNDAYSSGHDNNATENNDNQGFDSGSGGESSLSNGE